MPIKKNLQRFHDAQAGEERISYEIALAELQAGAKKNCWIWYIFPQLETEKLSETSKYYGICNFNEACDYLQDPVLFERYKTMVALVKDKLEKGTTVLKLMGKPIDAKKLASSLTLFREAASYLALLNDELSPEYKVLEDNCTDIFKIISKQNYVECQDTLANTTVANRLTDSKNISDTPLIAIPELPKKSTENNGYQKIKQAVINELENYIKQRFKEPSHWYQGLFKGFSKKEKLTAAISLQLVLVSSVDDGSELAEIIQKCGLDINQPRHQNIQVDLRILRQGRLGDRLRKLAKNDANGDWYKSVLGASPNQTRTVRGLIQYFLDSPHIGQQPQPK